MKKNLKFIQFVRTSDVNFGKFIIKPLDKGMGITLGNMFRRLLLTQISSTSIIGARIAGISHEFSTIAGVREDVLEILLNIRQINFKGILPKKSYARLKVQGPAIITANYINLDLLPNIQLVNPSQYIATILDASVVEMEFQIESSKDYSLSTNEFNLNSPNFLAVDKVSSPVERVVFEVDDTLSNQNKEELVLNVWTNGSITPQEAVIEIVELIQNLFSKLNKDNLKIVSKK
jgi:DNA-directed RNA polymerase subunit alpha